MTDYTVSISLSGKEVSLSTQVGEINVGASGATKEEAEAVLIARVRELVAFKVGSIAPYVITID